MSEEGIRIDGKAEIDALPEEVKNAPIGPFTGISSIALAMAMKYHDIGTVQDGVLYQQMKLDGKNLQPLHLDLVLDTAERLEKWLVGGPDRISKLMIAVIENANIVPEDDEEAADELAGMTAERDDVPDPTVTVTDYVDDVVVRAEVVVEKPKGETP